MPAEQKQIAFERINEFFRRIFQLKDSDKLQAFLRFLHRMPAHAPFNNGLVFAKRPDCYYYATVGQWQKRFQRTVVKRTLHTYGYPPDEQKMATDNILKQAELMAHDWSRQ